MIKPWDVIITILIISFSFIPYAIFSNQQAKVVEKSDKVEYVAVISSKNQEVKRINLTENKGIEILNLPGIDCGPDSIEVKDEAIRVRYANIDNCPDQICVRTGYISKPGPSIVCLPHQVVITVEAEGKQNNDDIIISS